jgi:hypothetical protein
MITFVRTVVALPGKLFELLAVAKETAGLVKRLTGKDIAVSGAVGGVVGEIALIGHYDSLAQFEEATAKIMADAEFRLTVKKFKGLVVPGTARDQMWRHF